MTSAHQVTLFSLSHILNHQSVKPEHYRPGSVYAKLAGKECSVALAKIAFEEEYLNAHNKIALNKIEKSVLHKWLNGFKQKYPVVGKLKEDKKNV